MQFNYVAYSNVEGVVKGKVDAENEVAAHQEVAQLGYRTLEVKLVRQLPRLDEIFPSLFKVKTGELVPDLTQQNHIGVQTQNTA